LRRVRVWVKRLGVRVMPLSWSEDSEEWYGLWCVRRILEINSASFWVGGGGEVVEVKKRKRREWLLRCEGFRRNAMATRKKEMVKLNDDGWWECDNETFFLLQG
jgi:hypothetical protein